MDEIEPLMIERIDDVPILLCQQDRMRVANLLDRHVPTHGNSQRDLAESHPRPRSIGIAAGGHDWKFAERR